VPCFPEAADSWEEGAAGCCEASGLLNVNKHDVRQRANTRFLKRFSSLKRPPLQNPAGTKLK